MNHSAEVVELYAALAKAQSVMEPAVKDANNPAFKSKYADLASVWNAVRGPLSSNGLSVMQDVTMVDNKVSVTTRLAHSSGQWQDFGPLVVPMNKSDAHGVGSATSYGRRYSLCAAVGVVQDDDDGNASTRHDSGPSGMPVARPIPKSGNSSDGAPMNDGQIRILKAKAAHKAMADDALAKQFGDESGWLASQFSEMQSWIAEQA